MAEESRIIPALDDLTYDQSLDLVSKVGGRVYAVKIHDMWDEHGPGIVGTLKRAGARRVWVDLKLKDIPNTVRLRARAIAKSGADILSVHASGGVEMMMAAVESGLPEIYAITALTSLDEADVELIYGKSPLATALYFSQIAKLASVHGVVCSPLEVGFLAKRRELKGLKLTTPGVRSAGKSLGDQKRVGTPSAAMLDGATNLVIGRQVTKAKDPVGALEEIEMEIAEALSNAKGV